MRPLCIISMLLSLVAVSVSNSSAQSRTINFSGYAWSVSDGNATTNNTNLWKSDSRMQYLDSKGRLHLKIKKIFGVWYCSQVKIISAMGTGIYQITIDSGSYYDDKRLVISFAINDDLNRNNLIETSENESEINLSVSKWNDEYKGNIWYYIKPFPAPNASKQVPEISSPGIASFNYILRAKKPVTHEINWVDRGTVGFKSFYGSTTHPVNNSYLIAEKTMNNVKTPQPGNAWITVNFWLYGSNDPAKPTPGDEYEIILRAFKKLPSK